LKANKKGQADFIAPLRPPYPCFVPNLGDSAGAGREGLARCKIRYYFVVLQVIL